ncbi:MAG TPA: DUF2189 domain-containing protein [Alphaproteobacteria bacterium]|nr:DUF2189 domain-containing protein [Alphaproteobacteria bacterium]
MTSPVPATGSSTASTGPALPVARIGVERPWRWLAAGWRDFTAAPQVSLAYGALFTLGGILLTAALWSLDWLYLALPLGAGFLLVAPVLATGLYEVSRQLEGGQRPHLAGALMSWRVRPGSLAVMGLVLMLFFLAWIRIAFLIFALFFGPEPPSWPVFIETIFFSAKGMPFLLVGTAVGAVLAASAFAISAVSIPLLLDRDVGAFAAMATSVSAVLVNWRVMIGWAALIALFGAAGLASFYVGLAVTLPLIGHATWHAYRDLVLPAAHRSEA